MTDSIDDRDVELVVLRVRWEGGDETEERAPRHAAKDRLEALRSTPGVEAVEIVED